jgi:hypothetical protein
LDDESGRRSDQQGQSHKAADVRTRKLPTSAAASLAGRLIIDQASKGLVEHAAPKMRKSPRSSRYNQPPDEADTPPIHAANCLK